jgi:hypothetical protein
MKSIGDLNTENRNVFSLKARRKKLKKKPSKQQHVSKKKTAA